MTTSNLSTSAQGTPANGRRAYGQTCAPLVSFGYRVRSPAPATARDRGALCQGASCSCTVAVSWVSENGLGRKTELGMRACWSEKLSSA